MTKDQSLNILKDSFIWRALDLLKSFNYVEFIDKFEGSELIDITNKPPKEEKHRGVFGTGFMVYNKSVFQDMFKYDVMIAIDEFLENEIYSKYQSYSPLLPICGQRNNQSDVSNGFYNNFYVQTYNWNSYCPNKIPNSFMDMEYVLNNRDKIMDYKILLRYSNNRPTKI